MIKTEFLLLILIFIIIYFSWKINCIEKKNIEHFTTTTTEEHIKRAVKQIYLADVEAIRILSNFAIQLSHNGYNIPGNITFDSVITNSSAINSPGITMGAIINGPASLTSSVKINKTLTVDDIIVVNNGNVKVVDPNPRILLTNPFKGSGNMIPTATEWVIEVSESKLAFWRYQTNSNATLEKIGKSPLLELYNNGEIVINGHLEVTNSITADKKVTISGLTTLNKLNKIQNGLAMNGPETLRQLNNRTTVKENLGLIIINGNVGVNGVLSCENNIITPKTFYYKVYKINALGFSRAGEEIVGNPNVIKSDPKFNWGTFSGSTGVLTAVALRRKALIA